MVPYINYKDLDEFYTLKGVCQLLKLDKETLRKKCEQYDIRPQRNEVGDWGLSRYDLRRLHNFLYKEGKDVSGKEDAPWALWSC